MSRASAFDIHLLASPGLEEALAVEVRALAFKGARVGEGGVTVRGGWSEVWRANLEVRGAGRVLAVIGAFPAPNLEQLELRARRLPWATVLRRDVPFRVEATCRASRIYHTGAAAERVERAIREEIGAVVSREADVTVRARIDDNRCTLSVDTSGGLLHKRGHKEAVAKAPMRETMASLLLRKCRFNGREPVLDPMCGSGTFVIEAAEIAAGLKPGRARSFAFERLATFDPVAWQSMRSEPPTRSRPAFRCHGSDRDAAAVAMSRENAERAGVGDLCEFREADVADIVPPAGPPGLVIVNPPYGTRIGERSGLVPLHRALGRSLATRFAGWRVGLVTADEDLARATGLPFGPPSPPILHGGLRVVLITTGPLP